MDEAHVDELVGALVQGLRSRGFSEPFFFKEDSARLPDTAQAINLLLSTEVSDSSRFYEEIVENTRTAEEHGQGRYHQLSLRRVLRNENAQGYTQSPPKKIWAGFVRGSGSYSSDVISRKLRADLSMVQMMVAAFEAGHPFSLLGKLETFEYGNPDERLYVGRAPLVIIPGAEGSEAARAWEDANTTYFREKGLIPFFRTLGSISREQYLRESH